MKTSAKTAYRTVKRRNSVQKIKRFGKQTLRDILLSKTFHTSFKIFIAGMVTVSALYGSYSFIGTTFANDVVVSKSEILAKVAKHVELPVGEPDDLVRIQDAEALKKQQEFFKDIEEGDYIIMYPELAIIYDLRNDSIVAMKKTSTSE
jgi:hypothetical protein